MDHHTTVRTGLNLLKPRLEAYLHSRLRGCFGAAYLGKERRLAERPDTQALLSILLDHWQSCLSGTLRPSVRSIAHELKAARNLWAHEEEITWDQAYRCLDNVQLMLHAIECHDANPEIERIKRSLRGEGASAPPVAPPPPSRSRKDSAPGDYSSFEEFIEGAVVPHRERHPDDARLDGRENGGNRQVFGRFWHEGELWRVNSDTHFEPLLIAYQHRDDGPLVEVETASGRALELREELQAARGTRHKHLYIYGEGLRSGAPGVATRRGDGRPRPGDTASGTAAVGRQVVVEELRSRGVEVSERREGQRHSLEIRHPASGQKIELRVKSRRSGTWQGRVSDGDAAAKPQPTPTYWIFVDLGSTPASFHIVPDEWIRRDIHEAHQTYLARHGGRRAITQESDHHAIQPKRIRAWRDRWDLLGV